MLDWFKKRRISTRRRSAVRRWEVQGEPLEARCVLANSPIISEFLAVNESQIVDEDGEHSDWIEVQNPTNQSISLAGWSLTDDAQQLSKWRFPATTLQPGEYRLVFASGKDRSNPGAALHTNFRLSAEGEYLALVGPDGAVRDAFSPRYTEQQPDVSYGSVGVDAARRFGFFATPTPGSANIQSPSPVAVRPVVISEIMYHPSTDDDRQEFVELTNTGSTAVDLTGWKFTDGVDFTFPTLTIPAGGQVVVAADLTQFRQVYGSNLPAVGSWVGQLSDRGETITLRDTLGRVVDEVEYADEGEWSERVKAPPLFEVTGWQWSDAHDGGGRSLELVNLRMPNEYGQNWKASVALGGSPGMSNSVNAQNVAPFVLDIEQSPIIPKSSESVIVRASVLDEASVSSVTLYWRDATQSNFNSIVLRDDGVGVDSRAGDGEYSGSIPPQPNDVVVEYYVQADDATVLSRSWPAPTGDSGQVTNALYQVNDAFHIEDLATPGAAAAFYQIMTPSDRASFATMDRRSDSQFHATIVIASGQGIDQRHQSSVRLRGSSSRFTNPPNNQIDLPADRPWNGITSFNMHPNSVASQVASNLLFQLAGLAAPRATPVYMYSNNSNLTNGRTYAQIEPLGSEFISRHYPLDDDGNLYKGRRPDESPPGGQGAGLVYFGEDPAPYVSYSKLTNEEDADWSDVIRLTDVLNNAPAETYIEQLGTVIDIDQWLRHMVMHALVSNTEFGLLTGDRLGDDYAMYRGVSDPRFQFIPHDLDSGLSQTTRTLTPAANVPALNRMLVHPELRKRYFDLMLELTSDVLESPESREVIRNALAPMNDPSAIQSVLNFMTARAQFVRSSLQPGIQVQTALPLTNGRVETKETGLGLWGSVDYRANSILVNGTPAFLSVSNGQWELGSSNTTVVPFGSTWSYLDDGSDPGANWNAVDYPAASNWNKGKAQLGYGDGDEATVIGAAKPITTYFRLEFDVADPSRFASLVVSAQRDDGIIFYLNGSEIGRNNLPNNVPVTAETLASTEITGGNESSLVTFGPGVSLLRAGKNVLAAEVHQRTANNEDLTFDARLTGRFNPPNGGVALTPGVNQVVIQAMSGLNGTGEVVDTKTIEVWRNDDSVQTVTGNLSEGQTTRWTAANGPYQVTGRVVVPVGATLVIEPGTSVYFEAGAELVVNGTLSARGTAAKRIRFTAVPGVPNVPNRPNGAVGLPDGPPRWKGIHFDRSMSADNVIAFADVEYAEDLNGSIGVLNSAAMIEGVTIKGTHLRMIYGVNPSLVVQDSVFPDMFAANEDPLALGLDNVAEQITLTGLPPVGGQLIIQRNRFGTNKGHNDVIDANSNRAGVGPVLQILDNEFAGTGDELLDLGGDVYVAGNLFRGVVKDQSTSDRGYASAISTGDAPGESTIVVARNIFYDVDHAINLRAGTATVFEYNTVVKVHPDFVDRFGNPVVSSVVNLYVDELGATPGRGAYVGANLFSDVPRVFGNVDLPAGRVSPLQFEGNLVSVALANTAVGQRPGTLMSLGRDNVVSDDVRLGNVEALDFQLAAGSRASDPRWPVPRGATAPEGLWISGEPTSRTSQRTAALTLGGPGMFAYRYRVNGGVWSDELPIGDGFVASGTQRTAVLALNGLANGSYFVEVIGRDFAGNWQVEPTRSSSWLVQSSTPSLLISEILASNWQTYSESGRQPDLIELHNPSAAPVNLRGWKLSDDETDPSKFVFARDIVVPAGGYLTLVAGDGPDDGLHLGFSLRAEGEGVYLTSPANERVDSVEFGLQVTDLSIGRVGATLSWQLTEPTFGAENQEALLGDSQHVVINEWLASEGGNEDYIELYNRDSRPVAIGGFWLSDAGDATPQRQRIADLSFMGGRQFAEFSERHASDRADHLAFGLSPYQETLRWSDSLGRKIDMVIYGPQTNGTSQGRSPNGEATWAYFSIPSPSWANGVAMFGDMDANGRVDGLDIDALCAAVLAGADASDAADLDRDGVLTARDADYLVRVVLGSSPGDANLDGAFTSSDLILIFQSGKYELPGAAGLAGWSSGDWNCDGRFDSRDLIAAFQAGGYENALPPAAEPAGEDLVFAAWSRLDDETWRWREAGL